MTKTALDELHLEMGRFLTESSQVENIMLSLFFICSSNRPREELFDEFMDATFGLKINKFKAVCNSYAFSEAHRQILNEAYLALDALLPRRNFIVHGATYQMGKGEIPVRPYRIGKRKGDTEFMNDAIADDFNGPHVFTAEGVVSVCEEFVALRAKLASVAIDVMQEFARKK